MNRVVKKCLELPVMLLLFSLPATGQAKSGLENYSFLGQGQPYTWMPVFHYETAGGMYTEIRYNYEALQTFSVYGGWTFKGGDNFKFSTTPMLVISAGEFSGVSVANNSEAEWNNIFSACQSQYSVGVKGRDSDFFFNWSELGYSFADFFYAGLAVQYTRERYGQITDPGFFAGVNFKNISIPVYVFNPFSGSEFYILGVNVNYIINNKKQDRTRKVY